MTGRTTLARADLWLALAIACICLVLPTVALGANPSFPGPDPYESPRLNTPDDSQFDECEGDDADGTQECQTYFEEQYEQFGFSPDSALAVPPAVRTFYPDCTQLDAQGRAANIAAEGGNPAAACYQIAGVRADTAWKFDTGNPNTTIAILDTGIRWQERELVDKVALNRDELPVPLHTGPPREGSPNCASFADAYDANGDGAFNVRDYVCDPRVAISAGDDTSDTGSNADAILDASDLIATFSSGSWPGGVDGGVDDDPGGNGYVDDIAGWDFFDDDNDPYDVSSCCSSEGHGTGRAREAGAQTNNGISIGPNQEHPTQNAGAEPGMCPDCQIMPLRVWDTFVAPIDYYAMGIVYAADNDAEVAEGAVGGLGNTRFAREAFEYADSKGLALMMVSSDINSANHNYPTNYNEAVYVAGSVPDTAPNDACRGPGGLGPVRPPEEAPDPPDDFEEGCDAFLDLLNQNAIEPFEFGAQPPTTSFFRNSNLTQYGGKADIVLMGSTGSQNTGQSAGAAGLLSAFGSEQLSAPLSGREIRQLLTMTAEDVRPANLGQIGAPYVDKANVGWEPHFGYGRLNLAVAMARIANRPPPGDAAWPCDAGDDNCIPPTAQIDSPDWFAPINVDRLSGGVPVRGDVAAPHTGIGSDDPESEIIWTLELQCGQDTPDTVFDADPDDTIGSGTGPVTDGVLGTIPQSELQELADTCNGEVQNDYGRPAGRDSDGWSAGDPYPDSSTGNPADNTDPERHAFQIRLTVRDGDDDPNNIGRYRKTLFAYNDDGNLPGWPRPIGEGSEPANYVTGSAGEVSPRLYDLNGDNDLDVILGTTSGELYVLDSDGSPLGSFNNGNPVRTNRYALELNHPAPGGVPSPRETPRVPAVGDIDGDLEVEIVTTGGEHVYAWNLDGTPVPKFQGGLGDVGVDRSLSEPCVGGPAAKPCFDKEDRVITEENHIKRGIFGSPALADLDCDGRLDIVSGAMDQHLYAWDGDGNLLPGFPKKLTRAGSTDPGTEIIATPAVAELDGRNCTATGSGPKGPEIVLATNEMTDSRAPGCCSPDPLFSFFNTVLSGGVGANPVYAVHSDGSFVSGWPVFVGVAAGDLLPLVLPGHDQAVLDQDGNGDDEVSISAGTSITPGGTRLVDGDGSTIREYQDGARANTHDDGAIINFADYQSIGDILGTGQPGVFKGGGTLNLPANLLAVNQNLPFNHVEQGWSLAGPPGQPSGAAMPGFPVATDDFQLVSQASIARVAPGGVGRQVLVGTGLYNLHAYGPLGLDPAGWPKFTGGWQQTTPAIGDVDGDGDLDISTVTREGWSFLWDTDKAGGDGRDDGVNRCESSGTSTNDEWWTYHHDEHSTNNYGHDGRPPGAPEDLVAVFNASGGIDVSWTAPGDDWMCGEANVFRVLTASGQITRPTQGDPVVRGGDPNQAADGAAGTTKSFTITAEERGTDNHVAVLYRDEARDGKPGNWGLLATVTAQGGDGGTDTDTDTDTDRGGSPAPCASAQTGTGGGDRLTGTEASELIRGRRGKDRIEGLGGDDCLFGNKGKDRIDGGAGNDELSGGNSRDRVMGGPGLDEIRSGSDGDRVKARDGERDAINCGKGRDKVSADDRDRAKGCEVVKRK